MRKVLSFFCLTFFLLFLFMSQNQAAAAKQQPAFLHITIFNQILIFHVLGLAEKPETLSYRTPSISPTPKVSNANPSPQQTTQPPSTTSQTNSPAPQPASDVASIILSAVNDYRASHGLNTVQMSGEVCAFAATRAQEIVTSFSHDGFSSRTDAKTLPYSSWSKVTENIAMTANVQDVVNMWANSPGHAANMRADTPFVCVQQSGNYFAYEGMKP